MKTHTEKEDYEINVQLEPTEIDVTVQTPKSENIEIHDRDTKGVPVKTDELPPKPVDIHDGDTESVPIIKPQTGTQIVDTKKVVEIPITEYRKLLIKQYKLNVKHKKALLKLLVKRKAEHTDLYAYKEYNNAVMKEFNLFFKREKNDKKINKLYEALLNDKQQINQSISIYETFIQMEKDKIYDRDTNGVPFKRGVN